MPLPRLSRLRVASRTVPGGGVRPVVPPVPDHMSPTNYSEWLDRIARGLNSVIQGKQNVVIDVELAASTTSTTIADSRIGAFSVILPSALSAASAGALGTMWFEVSAGSLTLHHNTDAAARDIRLAVFG